MSGYACSTKSMKYTLIMTLSWGRGGAALPVVAPVRYMPIQTTSLQHGTVAAEPRSKHLLEIAAQLARRTKRRSRILVLTASFRLL
jgi:hypothetical protein